MASEPAIKKIVWYGVSIEPASAPTRSRSLHVLFSREADLAVEFCCELLHITFIGRKEPSAYKNVPEGIPIVQIDLKDHKSLVKALTGADAVVVFTQFNPGGDLDIVQIALINAAIEAGVKLFVPSEWAPDTAGGNGATTARIEPNTLPPNPAVATKRAVHNYLMARSAANQIEFVSLHVGNLLINLSAFASLDMNKRTTSLGDGGHGLISVSSIDTLTRGLDSLLAKYPKLKNDFFYICDGETNLQRIVKTFQEASETKEPWKITSFSIAERKRQADENMRNGIFTNREFAAVLTFPFTGGLTVWQNPDNERLGLEPPSDAKAQKVVDGFVQNSIARGYVS